MKKKLAIFLVGIVVISAVVCIVGVLYLPTSQLDLIYKNIDKMSYYGDEVEVALKIGEIQRVDENLYYIDKNNNLICRESKNEKIVLNNIAAFLVKENVIFFLDDDGMYLWEKGKNKIKLLRENVYSFAIGKDFYMIYTGKHIYIYDDKWNQRSMCELEEVHKGELYGDIVYYQNNFIICDNEGEMVIYSIQDNEFMSVDLPVSSKYNHVDVEVITDIIKKDKKIYCMLAVYERADVYSCFTRIENPVNGVYHFDISAKKFEKISSVCGFELLCLEDELFVIDSSNLFSFVKAIN